MAEVRMVTGWEQVVNAAALPQFEDMADLINEAIISEAPVVTGNLRDASEAVVEQDPDLSLVVGVDTELAPYAGYVINGTSMQEANDYIGRAVEAALSQRPGGPQ